MRKRNYIGALLVVTWLVSGSLSWVSGEIVFSELMYNPPENGGTLGSELEFLELLNTSNSALDLSSARFDDGISFTFPEGTVIDGGGFLVLASNRDALLERYPGLEVEGEYEGQLANSGEIVRLVDSSGAVLFSVEYDDVSPWPLLADGAGKSIVLRDVSQLPSSPDDYTVWRTSSENLGSPGSAEPVVEVVEVVINEVLAHTDEPLVDSIELFNPFDEAADVSGWYLSDEYDDPKRYRIPDGSVLSPRGYLVIDERSFGIGATGFSLSSHGESVWLFSADDAGDLTGYAEGVDFGASENGVSFGRYVLSTGEVNMVAMESLTLGSENGEPLLGDVVFSEILYEPEVGGIEYVELINTSEEDVRLYDIENPINPWRIGGLSYRFPLGLTLKVNQIAVVANVTPDVFREKYGELEGVMVLGPYSGALDNAGERLSLERPDSPDMVDGAVFVPYIDVDVVGFDDEDPWPLIGEGEIGCIEKLERKMVGLDSENWSHSLVQEGSPGWVRGMNYSIWKRARFSDEDLSLDGRTGPNDDFDGNGWTNLAEYSSGIKPCCSGEVTIERIAASSEEAIEVKLTSLRSVYASDVEWRWFSAEELGDTSVWSEYPLDVLTTLDLGDGSERHVFRDSRSEGELHSLFYRLQVQLSATE